MSDAVIASRDEPHTSMDAFVTSGDREEYRRLASRQA
jgi:hypothetical protein